MVTFYHHYPVSSPEELRKYLAVYFPLVEEEMSRLGINLRNGQFALDHVGLQVLSSDELHRVDELLKTYSDVTEDRLLHDRRVIVYRFKQPLTVQEFTLLGVEAFEPKPIEAPSTPRLGIEHIAITASNFPDFKKSVETTVPIAKSANYGSGSFFKTVLCNGVEVEFRDRPLIAAD